MTGTFAPVSSALRRVAELMKSVAEGSENTGRAIPGETVTKPLLSLDQKFDFYLLLLYPSQIFTEKEAIANISHPLSLPHD